MADVGHLFLELSNAISILSGIQQPPSPTENENNFAENYEEGEYEIERIAKEIYVGLTGKKVISDVEVE